MLDAERVRIRGYPPQLLGRLAHLETTAARVVRRIRLSLQPGLYLIQLDGVVL